MYAEVAADINDEFSEAATQQDLHRTINGKSLCNTTKVDAHSHLCQVHFVPPYMNELWINQRQQRFNRFLGWRMRMCRKKVPRLHNRSDSNVECMTGQFTVVQSLLEQGDQ